MRKPIQHTSFASKYFCYHKVEYLKSNSGGSPVVPVPWRTPLARGSQTAWAEQAPRNAL